MSQSSPLPNATPQPSQSKTIPSKLLLWPLCISFGLIILFALAPSLILALTSVRNTGTAPNVSAATSTPTSAQVQDLSNKAELQLQQANNLLNLETSLATVMGVVLAIFAIVTFSLGAIGYFTNNGFKDLEEKFLLMFTNIEKHQQGTVATAATIEGLRVKITLQQEALTQEAKNIAKRFDETNRAMVYLFQGNQFIQQKRKQEALVALESAQKLRPEDAVFNYELGSFYSHLGYTKKAIFFLDLARKADEEFAPAVMELGLAHRRQGNILHEEALTHTIQAQREQWHAEAKEHYDHAVKYLEKAIELHPGYVDALATFGGLYRRLGAYDNDNSVWYRKALAQYQIALAADQDSSYALGNVASLSWYFAETDQTLIEEATAYFRRCKPIAERRIAESKDPLFVHWDYYDLALAQLALGETEQSHQTYKVAMNKTTFPIDFDGVLSNLLLLQKARTQMEGLDLVITQIKERLTQVNASVGLHSSS